MKFSYTRSCGITRALLFTCLFFSIIAQAQVGIGNTNPNTSSALDITSTTQGLLAPRMTTLQRIAIVTPANSLLVYDTDLKSFYYYDLPSITWVKINSSSSQRNNYKLIKSVTDLATELANGGGTKYLLTSNTYYEINGSISLNFPIDLNNAYLSGLDANEDILSFPGGVIFKGNTGGSIRNVTLKGAKSFEITGPGISTATSLLVQNTIVDGMTTSVGTISGIGLYFGNIVQFINNTAGITYTNIGNLLLNNQAWFATNSGTFETFTGAFGLIEKASGFSSVDGADVAIDVSSNPAVSNGVLQGTVFSGTTSAPSGYIKKYTIGTFIGYNFSISWAVNCPGIPEEIDAVASGNIYVTAPQTTTFSTSGSGGRKKLVMTTTSTEMFRTSSIVDNRITYSGAKTRKFNIAASFSVDAVSSNKFFTFFIAKNGTVLPATSISTKVVGGGDVRALSFTGTTTMAPGDYIEVWAQNDSDTSGLIIPALNLLIN